MTNEIMYSEIYGFLCLVGEYYIDKIPTELFNFIKSEARYEVNLSTSEDINGQLSENAIAFIAYLNLQYWCDTEEKNRLMKLYHQNDLIDQKISEEKYNSESLFKKRDLIENQIILKNEEIKENQEMIAVQENSFFERIIKKIKSLFRFK